MIPWQPLQVLLNIALAMLAGWLVRKGVNEGDAHAITGAVAAMLAPMVLSFLQRRKLLLTDPPAASTNVETTSPRQTLDQVGGRAGILLLALVLIGTGGCQLSQAVKSIDAASIHADQARRDALEPVVQEHIARHPEQELTWTMLMQAWGDSIAKRRQAIAGSTPTN